MDYWRASTLLDETLRYSQEQEYRGYDKADELSSRILDILSFDNKWVNIAFQESAKHAPVNIRAILLIEQQRNLKRTALFVCVNLTAWQATGEDRYREVAIELLQGDVLNAPEFGVLSFRPADIRKYRRLRPSEVWIDNQELISVTLQRTMDNIDSGEIIAYDEVKIENCKILWKVYEKVHDAKVELLSKGIKLLRDRPTEAIIHESICSYSPTSLRQELSFSGWTLLKNTKGRIRSWIGNKL